MSKICVSGVKVAHAHRTLQKLYRELLSMLGSHSSRELGLRLGKMSISTIPLAERDLNWKALGQFESAWWFEPTAGRSGHVG